jgi:tRNA(His) 5'-end guanylyltransferase
MLRRQGITVTAATHRLEGMSVADKNELLFTHSINFNDLPAWQKRGVGVYWESFTKEGYSPITQQPVTTQRQRLFTQYDLPLREDYSRLIEKILLETHLKSSCY